MRQSTILVLVFFAGAAASAVNAALEEEPAAPNAVLQAIRLPDGFTGQLVANETQVANPVAFCLDDQQRILVAETFRQQQGVEDVRNRRTWLEDDLAAQSVEDRLAYMTKHLEGDLSTMTRHSERIRLLVDLDGDRVVDRSTVFAEDFDEAVDGTGADVRAIGGDVYYACIPNLWLLRDDDGDGRADSRTILHSGFGVRFAFRGHDLHGMVLGPDGRLYFSIGDRGLNVVSKEGKRLKLPDRGAVLRCEPDGANLEVFASGYRNPQELAFDRFGNLFTVDNNSDHAVERARVVYIPQGADAGWRMHYQHLADRGPWVRERLWETRHPGQAAYIVPPIEHLSNGPSGLAFYPGMGLPAKYDDHFFFCDFTGTDLNSGIRSFATVRDGAFFRLQGGDELIWQVLATDLEFGHDGSLYVSDWISGWEGTGKGRIFRFYHPETVIAQPHPVLSGNFEGLEISDLLELLAHPDQRVRQRCQFRLAERGELEALVSHAQECTKQTARLHSIWAIGQIARGRGSDGDVLLPFLSDADPEIRAQSARTMADLVLSPDHLAQFAKLLTDESPRVRFFAALALGKCRSPAAIPPLLNLLAENEDRDALLRHAAVMGLAAIGDEAGLVAALERHPPSAVRLGILLALRRLGSAEIASFLDDDDPQLVLEAARAIHDESLDEAMPQLAHLSPERFADATEELRDALARRVINANYRLGTPAGVVAWCQFAAITHAARTQGLQSLIDWAQPSRLDAVLGEFRPLPQDRDTTELVALLRANLPAMMRSQSRPSELCCRLAARYGIREAAPHLSGYVGDTTAAATLRAEALVAMESVEADGVLATVQECLEDQASEVRVAALGILCRLDPAGAVPLLRAAMDRGEWRDQQQVVGLLAGLESAEADKVLAEWLQKLHAGECPKEIELDLREAAAARDSDALRGIVSHAESVAPDDDPVAEFHGCLHGGSLDRGRSVFFDRIEVSCSRCHRAGHRGDSAGPNLSLIGKDKTREYLLDSIVLPSKHIAQGFETVVVVTDEGKVISGIVRNEDEIHLELILTDLSTIRIPVDQIEERSTGPSAMPANLATLISKRELRDLIEFLASLRGYEED